jgi:hypothetical protein
VRRLIKMPFLDIVVNGLKTWILDETQEEPAALLSLLQPPELVSWIKSVMSSSNGGCFLLKSLMDSSERYDWDTWEEKGDLQLRLLTLLVLVAVLKHTGLLSPLLSGQLYDLQIICFGKLFKTLLFLGVVNTTAFWRFSD